MQVLKRFVISLEMDWDSLKIHFKLALVDKKNRYELYAEPLFTKLSTSPCYMVLYHQSYILKRFVDDIKFNHEKT